MTIEKRFLVASASAVLMAASGMAPAVPPALVDCPQVAAVGDTIGQNGFYVPSYPGISLKDVTLYLDYGTSGTYTVSLTAHRDAFDGPVLGTASVTAQVGDDTELPQTFAFGNVPVTPGTTVAFTHAVVSGPSFVNYAVIVRPGCGVYETVDFSPPLSTVRRDGVAIRITGDPDPAGRLSTLVIPAVASIHGANDTFFHSDVYLLNRDSNPLEVHATYRCYTGQSCGSGTATFTMAGFTSKTFRDVVSGLFGSSETAGAVELSYRSRRGTGEDLAGYSRVYTPELPRPTNGSQVLALGGREAIGVGTLLGVGNNGGNRSAGFRTNAGAYNPNDAAVTVSFEIFRSEGTFSDENRIGTVTQTWGPREARQINDVFAAAGAGAAVTTDAFIRVRATRPVFPYATVIDNVTGDSVVVMPSKQL